MDCVHPEFKDLGDGAKVCTTCGFMPFWNTPPLIEELDMTSERLGREMTEAELAGLAIRVGLQNPVEYAKAHSGHGKTTRVLLHALGMLITQRDVVLVGHSREFAQHLRSRLLDLASAGDLDIGNRHILCFSYKTIKRARRHTPSRLIGREIFYDPVPSLDNGGKYASLSESNS